MFGISPAGTTVWIYAEEGNRLRLSSDQGLTWHVSDATRHAAETGEDIPLVHAACLDTNRCYLLFQDGLIVETAADLSHRPIANLPDELPAESGYLIADSDGKGLVFLEDWAADAYRSTNQGKSWKRVPLGAEGYWSAPERFRGVDSFLLPGEDKAVIMPRLRARWTTINPWSWDEDMHFCWGTTTEPLYAFNEENLAMSLDTGKSWQRNSERLNNPPFCGINNGLLWLNHQGMRVLRLDHPDGTPPGTLTAAE